MITREVQMMALVLKTQYGIRLSDSLKRAMSDPDVFFAEPWTYKTALVNALMIVAVGTNGDRVTITVLPNEEYFHMVTKVIKSIPSLKKGVSITDDGRAISFKRGLCIVISEDLYPKMSTTVRRRQ